jgi:hypothetical protein
MNTIFKGIFGLKLRAKNSLKTLKKWVTSSNGNNKQMKDNYSAGYHNTGNFRGFQSNHSTKKESYFDRDFRGRKMVFKDGKRVLHRPKKQIEDCFQVENVSWSFSGTDKTGKQTDFKTASATREREFRQENKHLFLFT